MNRMHVPLLALILMLQVPGIAWADVPANIPLNRSFYVEMQGSKYGVLKGGPIIPTKGREGWMEGLWLEHGVYKPLDTVGLRGPVHKPLSFVKRFDQASPLLFRSFTEGEGLRVIIHLVRLTATGTEVAYGTIELSTAFLMHFRQFTQGTEMLEEVTLVYKQIKVTNLEKGTTWTAFWPSPAM